MSSNSPNAAIIAIGNELTTGAVVDTNSSYLAGKLGQAGFRVRRVALVEDDMDRIKVELAAAAQVADIVITTGGLGPTTDDLTREAVAAACGVTLFRNEESIDRMKALFERRGRPFAPINERQAYFPVGAEVLPNSAGTADSFITDYHISNSTGGAGSIPLISLPGVPREMKQLMAELVLPWLANRFPQATADIFAYLRCFGLSESYIGGMIEGCGISKDVTVAYRPTFPEILLSFRASGKGGQALVEAAREKARVAIGPEFIISNDPNVSLPARVIELLTERGMTIASAESCTGGMIIDKLVSVPGASRAVFAGVVCYSNAAKQAFLGVKPLVIDVHGAVSKEVAEQMAEHARVQCGATIGVSTTGIAGPDGGTDAKPVGTVWIGLASGTIPRADGSFSDPAKTPAEISEAGRKIETFHLVYPAERSQFRNFISSYALDLVRRHLLGYPLSYVRR